MPVQQQPMTPMPFYADPNRFPTPVWQADPSQVTGWQGQFIQQIPPAAQPIETYQQYPNGIYQTTYQQPAFETNTFYTGAVQVLTPTNTRPPSTPNQQAQMIPPRPNSNYAHTPSPSPAGQQNQQPTGQQNNQQQTNANRQYQEYNQFASNASGNEGSQSRPSSVNSVVNQNPTTPNQNYPGNQSQNQQQNNQQQQQAVYATVSTANFSPSSGQGQNQQQQYVTANSGNGQPGYPQVNTSSPQVVSHNSSGYPGNGQFSGQQQQQQQQQQQWQTQQQLIWEQHQQQPVHEHYMVQHQKEQSENSPGKMQNENSQKTFSQADKVNLNTRIKTMILNKQQNDSKMEQEMKGVEQNNSTGHFLWHSHHHHLDSLGVDGGPKNVPKRGKLPSQNTEDFAQRNFRDSKTNLTYYNELSITGSLRAQRPLSRNTVSISSELHMRHIPSTIAHPNDLPFKTENEKHPNVYQPHSDYRTYLEMEKQEQTSYDQPLTPKTPQSPTISSLHSPRSSSTPTPLINKSYGYVTPSAFLSPERNQSWLQDKKKLHSPESRVYTKKEKSPTKLVGEEIPRCQCFPSNQSSPPEPGTYYTHLGCANNLKTLRHNLECQTGHSGKAIRIEKVRYTGKEGKTAQGCPIVKWIHRRGSLEEKYLVIVKQRPGHYCHSAFIVICMVVWEGMENVEADDLYNLLTEKLNKFGLPTKRRCATNDPRTCACQGINEDTCGASFSFGCSWSMYYNGCRFTRSKDVRKFRLSVKEEEFEVEKRLEELADHISPMYRALAPQSFNNQILFENVASDCRLGAKTGRPFSGVTACMDFCAHAHKDIHNMNNGLTVVVTLTKHRSLSKAKDEQLHVLPLYVPDTSDEFGSRVNQDVKAKQGEVEVLDRYECEVRTFSEPAEKCRNRKSKKEEGERKRKSSSLSQPSSPSVSSTTYYQSPLETPIKLESPEIQSGHVSSTVLDAPSWRYDSFVNGVHSNFPNHLPQFSVFKSPQPAPSFSNHYNQAGFLNNYSNQYIQHPTPNLFSHFNPSYNVKNPFDDQYSNNILPPHNETKSKSVNIEYTDNSECFKDPDIGGVAIALSHGSILFECAKHELHATTALKKPDRSNPTRISLVFYQHRNLNKSQHGLDEYTLKQKSKVDGAQAETSGEFEASFDSSTSSLDNEVVIRSATLPTFSVTTMFPMYPCMVTGAYQEPYAGTLSMPNK